MDSREFFWRYSRSPWGIGSAFVALGAGGASMAIGAGPLGGLGVAVAVAAGSIILSLATGIGQRAAVAEGERAAEGRAAERLDAAAAARARLAALRLPEGEVAKARDLIVLEAGRLVDAFVVSRGCDPEAAQAVLDSLELVDAYQRERDQASTERRFGLPDADPFPEAERRTAEALRGKAALIAARRAGAAGEIPPADLIAIEEELK